MLNLYYLILRAAFELIRFKLGIQSALTLLAGIDRWLANHRLVFGSSAQLTDWQNQADSVRDQAFIDFTLAVHSEEQVSDMDNLVPSFSADPVQGWRLLEELADDLAMTASIVKLEAIRDTPQQSEQAKHVVSWLRSLIVPTSLSVEGIRSSIGVIMNGERHDKFPVIVGIVAVIGLLKDFKSKGITICHKERPVDQFVGDLDSTVGELIDDALSFDPIDWNKLGLSEQVMKQWYELVVTKGSSEQCIFFYKLE